MDNIATGAQILAGNYSCSVPTEIWHYSTAEQLVY